MPHQHSIAAFVVSNEPYCAKAIMALLAVRQHNPDFDLFIAGDIKTGSNLNLLDRFQIKLISLSYAHVFVQPKCTWPSEVWWLPLIPSHLYQMGYDVSLGLDGDIYTVKPFKLDVVNLLIKYPYHIAGIKNRPICRYITLDEWPPEFSEHVCKIYNLDKRIVNEIQCTNSGLLWFNNELLYEDKFDDKWIKAYKDIINTWEKYSNSKIFNGDQEGFALLIPSIRFLYISPFYNFRFHDDLAKRVVQNDCGLLEKELMAIHFVHSKPWYHYSAEDEKRYQDDIGDGKLRLKYIRKWQSDARKIFGDQCEKLRILELDKTHWSVVWQRSLERTEMGP